MTRSSLFIVGHTWQNLYSFSPSPHLLAVPKWLIFNRNRLQQGKYIFERTPEFYGQQVVE